MKIYLLLVLPMALLSCLVANHAIAQSAVVVHPEHGFLPGKKLEYYPALDTYDFRGFALRVEVQDRRSELQLRQIACSAVELSNESEFRGEEGMVVVNNYFQKLAPPANLKIDAAATDLLQVQLDALDARLLGFGNITAHGLCQLTMKLHGNTKTYCIDITDKSPHSPISSHAFVSRKTATRIIVSIAVREAIETFFSDLKSGTVFPAS